MTSINDQLYKLYSSNWNGLPNTLTAFNDDCKEGDEATTPLLLQMNEHYATADKKIMLFGQATNNWKEWTDEKKESAISPLNRLKASLQNCYVN
ncbi:MAG: hypothetical protein LBJ39_03435 [Tannerellaceae bacterium]|jgi:hypothetical protein|nr:hypothetical protein [Tannerellaceae bacterium]